MNQQSRVQNLVQTKEQQIMARNELLRNANRCWAFSAEAWAVVGKLFAVSLPKIG